jgi:nicotinamide mononucleotide transporter
LWLHGGPNHSRLPVTQLTSAQKVWLGIAVVLCVLTLGVVVDRYTDADLPFLDAMASGASVPAQILLMRKKLESWYMWFVIDVLYVGIYIYKEVYLTAGLYVLFLGLAVAGLIEWKKTLNSPAPASVTA